MALREALNDISPDYAAEALRGQIASDNEKSIDDADKLIDKYKRLLSDYPALQKLFDLIAQASLSLEGISIEDKKSVIIGAGAALQGVKAMANKQVFDDLETPTDLED
jgi:hypothetical protein